MILINPYYDRAKKLGIFARYVPLSVPMGIGALAGYLLQQGKQVKILDEHLALITAEVLDDCIRDISEPYIFGISCVSAGIGRGYALAKIIKTKYPDSKVIMGGIHPTVLPQEALDTGFVDIVVRGEGEQIMDILYGMLKAGQDYSRLEGISFRDDAGHIVHNAPAKLPDINSLPPFPYHLFAEHKEKYDLGFAISSRGCPYNCIFCSQRAINGRLYRYMPPEKIIDGLDLLINKYEQARVNFHDDNFVVNKERTKRLCELICSRNLHKKAGFGCQTRGDAIDRDVLSYLKAANFTAIDIGFETASERLMALLNKGEKVQDNIKAAKLLQAFGFQISTAFILGLPTETREERWQAYRLAKELKLNYVRFNNATPYPGTRLYEIAKEENGLNIEENWSNLNACGTLIDGPFSKTKLAYVPATTTERELRKDILRINLFFSLNPRRVFGLLFRGGAPGWMVFPKRWYFSPKEWYCLAKLGFNVAAAFLSSLLP